LDGLSPSDRNITGNPGRLLVSASFSNVKAAGVTNSTTS